MKRRSRTSRTTRAGPGIAAALTLALAAAGPVWGLSMRHSAAEPRLSGASPGARYALGDDPVGLVIVNTGRDPARVDLEVREPDRGELRDGFEPVPKGAWLALERATLELPPGGTAAAPATLTLPKKPDALGQFQAQLVSESRAPDGALLRLVSSVLVALADEDEDKVAKAREKAARRPGVETLLAARERSFTVELGKKAQLPEGAKVANVGEEPAVVVATVESPPAEGLPAGVEPSPNPRFLRLLKRVETLAPGKVGELELEFYAPDQPRYRGRTWAFDVAIETVEREQPKVERFRVYAATPRGEKATGR